MSGTRGVGGGSKAGTHKGGAGTIPQASKKMLQSLKEIVNCPEAEIHAMLKECNMDPNEAVNRLLSQDPFHQVKSKREKKKENKDATGLRSHGTIGTSNRGVRGGNDRYSHAILSQFSSSESIGLPYKNDNGDTKTSSSSGPGVAGNNMNWMPLAASEMSVEDKSLTVNNSEGVSSSQHASSFHSPWLGVPGQVSMADIVKMGRPHVRGSSNATRSHQSAADYHVAASQFAPTPQELYSSQNYVAKVSDVNLNIGLDGNRNVPELDDWPQDEQPSTLSMPLVSEPQVTYEPYKDPSRLLFDRTSHHLDDFQCADDAEPDSVIPSKMQDESSGSAPILNDELHDSINSYQFQQDAYENQEVEDIGVSVSSVATNVQQLSLSKEEDNSFPERESPSVKIPEHLQVRSADCSHLSFGSFGSGISVPFSGLFASKPPKRDVEETSAADDAQSLGNTDSRSSYEDEHLRTASGGNSDHRLGVSSGKYDMPSASQSDTLKQEAPEVVARGNEYSFPSSPNYTFENSQHLNPSLSHSQMSSQMQNLPILSGIMPYSSSMPSSLLPTNNVHPDRDADRSYSPFHITPSMPTKFGSSASEPINVPSGSMHEALKTGNFPSPELTQNIPVSNISEGLTFPQHLPVHPYSQPSFPFANMISYPFLPQSYTYMPPAFQQALAAASNSSYHAFQQAIAAAGNSTYHQSPSAGVLPQYKNSVSASSLPQSATVPSGYGAFGNSTSIPGNFSMNPPSAAPPTASSVNYEDILSSQYKDAAQLLALQQGLGSRTMPAVPASTYYSFQEQSHQPSGYRQSQQQPPHQFGGYPNFYHSQSGVPQQQQQLLQQMSRDGSLVASQGQQQQQPKQQPQQMWQNGY